MSKIRTNVYIIYIEEEDNPYNRLYKQYVKQQYTLGNYAYKVILFHLSSITNKLTHIHNKSNPVESDTI